MTPQQQQKLERLMSDALRDLPPRRAPSSLEQRVQAEIARRAALPWWRKSFAYWPIGARAGFALTAVALMAVVFAGTRWATAAVTGAHLKAAFTPQLQSAEMGIRLFHTVSESVAALVASIPAIWLYGGAAIVVALYMALFGLGAAAYRTLYASN